MSGWQRRYFVLRNGMLSYSDTQEAKVRGTKTINLLQHCRVVRASGGEQQSGGGSGGEDFEVHGQHDAKPMVLLLRAGPDSFDAWITALEKYQTTLHD